MYIRTVPYQRKAENLSSDKKGKANFCVRKRKKDVLSVNYDMSEQIFDIRTTDRTYSRLFWCVQQMVCVLSKMQFERKEEFMKINDVQMNLSAVKPEHYPKDNLLEIAFAGRSNVGKSSAINTLLKRRSIARVSQSPGKTRTINFFTVNQQFYFVDLPGYGYAKLSKAEQEHWGKMMEDYFIQSSKLIHLFLLVDIRHEPKDTDVQMYEFSKHWNIPVSVIATKSDKIKKSQLLKNISIIRKKLNMSKEEPVLPISSLKKTGVDEIWEKIIAIFAEQGVDIDNEKEKGESFVVD